MAKHFEIPLDGKCPDWPKDLPRMITALNTLSNAHQVEFGEWLLERKLGYSDDYYSGWDLNSDVVLQVLTASPCDLAEGFVWVLGLQKKFAPKRETKPIAWCVSKLTWRTLDDDARSKADNL